MGISPLSGDNSSVVGENVVFRDASATGDVMTLNMDIVHGVDTLTMGCLSKNF